MREFELELRACGALALSSLLCAACASSAPPADTQRQALVGEDPVSTVHLFENNSSALIAWRGAEVRDRILVHLDGHPDLDWLPDATVARIAAARSEELSDLELHPYSMRADALSRFGIDNFIYAAARLGMVRELVWVVPDGTLRDQVAANQLIREMLIHKVQMIGIEEARTLRFEPPVIRGEILGLPITVCELAHLPGFEEPVLLDIDLDYFTTRSALTRYVTDRPWAGPGQVLRRLRGKGLRTDLATLSLSTIGGFAPPTARWVGRSLQHRLRFPREPLRGVDRQRLRNERAQDAHDPMNAVRRYRRLLEREPEDATLWLTLAEALETSGRDEEAGSARERAAALDPLLEHADLFVGDRLWNNGGPQAALARYERYLDRYPMGPFSAHAWRRKAACLRRLGRPDEALQAFMRVIHMEPDHADTRFEFGLLLREQGAMRLALEQLSMARWFQPERARYAVGLGNTYLANGMLGLGIRELEFAVQRQPCLAGARGTLSAALLKVGRYEDAARHLQLALAFQPDNPELLGVVTQLSNRGVRVRRVSAR